MKLKQYLLLTVILFSASFGFSQDDNSCKGFAKSGLVVLDTLTYVHDGHYNTLKLTEGDKIDIYKPFYKGRKYKIVAMSAKALPGLTISIKNVRRQELYKSDAMEYTQMWEYIPEKTENLIISVEIPVKTNEDVEKLKRDCVAILIGFAPVSN